MKKTLLSLVLLASTLMAESQITLNSSNVLDIGVQFEMATDAVSIGLSIGASGKTSWNFSGLTQNSIDTFKFVNSLGNPGASDFPNSNLAFITNGDNSFTGYFTKNSLEFRIDGAHYIDNGQGVSNRYEAKIVTFPSTYQTSYTETLNYEIDKVFEGRDPDGTGPHGTVDSIKVTSFLNGSSNMDAWGDITTPLGTFPSIRQNMIENYIDTTWQLVNGNWEILSSISASFFGLDAIEKYTYRTARWWTNDNSIKFLLAEMDYEVNGAVNFILWLKSSLPVGVKEINNLAEVSAYPNPAKNKITIETLINKKSSIDVLDVTGKLIQNMPFVTNTITLSVADYNNGLYFYNIKDVAGDVIYSNKFIVAK